MGGVVSVRRLTVTIEGELVVGALDRAIDVSIPLVPNGPQPHAFGLGPATSAPFISGGFIAEVSRGGPVNCFSLFTWPHGNGTHTETVGHICHPAPPVGQTLGDLLVPSTLVSLSPVALSESGESYTDPHDERDEVITEGALERALGDHLVSSSSPWCEGLLIRTSLGRKEGPLLSYSGENPPYLTHEAMALVRRLGVRHLIVDIPSVDREEDAGLLSNHRLFWGVEPGVTDVESALYPCATITEMMYAPDHVEDGRYLLNLQVGPIAMDAAASRPILIPIDEKR